MKKPVVKGLGCGTIAGAIMAFICFLITKDLLKYQDKKTFVIVTCSVAGLIVFLLVFLLGIDVTGGQERGMRLFFYNRCVEQDIDEFDSERNYQKAVLIAKEIGLGKSTDKEKLKEYYALGKSYSERNKEIDAENELSKIKKEEKEKYAWLTEYKNYTGREKRIKMLTDLRLYFLSEAREKHNTSNLINNGGEKEGDWAIRGGIASAIAGGAAGAAVAIDTQIKNAEIRARNEQRKENFSMLDQFVNQQAAIFEEKAKELLKEIDEAKIKLVSDKPSKEVFENLKFGKPHVEIFKSRAFTVEVEVEEKEPVKVFDNTDSLIDGSFCADLYQNGKLAGSAIMVLPVYGTYDECIVKGMCLEGADMTLPYEVKFRDNNLWEMER